MDTIELIAREIVRIAKLQTIARAVPTWSPTVPTRGKWAAWRLNPADEPTVVLVGSETMQRVQFKYGRRIEWHELPD